MQENTSVFDYKTAAAYLQAWLKSRPARGHGERKRLAEATRTHSALITQVLQGKAHFTLEQALRASDFFDHAPVEKDFFLYLVQHDRAGSKELAAYYRGKLDAILSARRTVKSRWGGETDALSLELQTRYYSHWLYAALHLATTVPSLETRSALAAHFHRSRSEIDFYLDFLIQAGLVEEEGGVLRPGTRYLFIDKSSPLIAQHHAIWRRKATDAALANPQKSVHYSVVASLSQADAKAMQTFLLDQIEAVNARVRASKSEEIYNFNLDWYPL